MPLTDVTLFRGSPSWVHERQSKRQGDHPGGKQNRNRAEVGASETQSRPSRYRARAADGRARYRDRQRCAAVDPALAALQSDRSRMGRQRLHHCVRRTAAARRPHRRPVRTAPHVHRRRPSLHGGLARWGARHFLNLPDPRPRGAGSGRSDPRPNRAFFAGPNLHRRKGAEPSVRRVLGGVGRRRRGWPAARRDHHQLLLVALDHVRQRSDRPSAGVRRTARLGPQRRAAWPARPSGRRHRKRGRDAPRLRPLASGRARLER